MHTEWPRLSKRLKDLSPLHAFVLVYANTDGEGSRLYQSEDMKEVLMFEVWLRATAELGIQCPAPAGVGIADAIPQPGGESETLERNEHGPDH